MWVGGDTSESSVGQIGAWLTLFLLSFGMLSLHLYLQRLHPINLRIDTPVVMWSPSGVHVTAVIVVPRNVENVAWQLAWIDPDGIVAGSSAQTVPGDRAQAEWRRDLYLDSPGQWVVQVTLFGSAGARYTDRVGVLVSE